MAKIVTVDVCKGTEGKPKVFLATPSYDGKVCQPYVASLAASVEAMRDAGIGAVYCLMGGNCHVDDSRNGLVREFMQTDCTDLIFLDADIGWRPEDLVSLALSSQPIVGGAYPKKGDQEDYPVHVLPGTVLQANEEGLVEVYALPTGFLKISRFALETLHRTHGQRRFTGQNAKPDEPPYVILFERTYADGHRWSGDYAFCRKWAETGGHLWVDPRFYFVHEGDQQWSGSLGEFWRNKHGVTAMIREEKFVKAVEALRSGAETAADLTALVEGWGNEWSAGVELLDAVIQLARAADGPILECGSGLTTFAMGLVSRHTIIALEHSPVWASYTEEMLRRFEVPNTIIHCAPLVKHDTFDWYATPAGMPDFALAVVDGPPRKTRGGRTGIATIKHLLSNATILLDDPADDMLAEIGASLETTFTVLGDKKPYAVGKVVEHDHCS